MTKEELIELLKEARNWVGGWSGILPMAMKDIDTLRERIDAALAAHEAEVLLLQGKLAKKAKKSKEEV